MYNLKEIKSIPCKKIAEKFGINLSEKHGRLWGKLRQGEKTASFSINTKNNLWYDFGSGKGGSVIDLLAELEGISPKDAINKLAEEFGFKNEYIKGWNPLTDSQYKEIGIKPERATMNFAFDLNKHTVDQLERWSNKYGMHVKDLAIKYPDVYNKMITKIANEEIREIKETYLIRKESYTDPNTSRKEKIFLKEMSKFDAVEINNKVDLFQRALTTSAISHLYLKVNFEKDFPDLELNKTANIEKNDTEKLRDSITSAYKKLFNYNQIDYFSDEQIKALSDINKFISNNENKFIPISGIYDIYKNFGNKLEKNSNENHEVIKDLFNKCSKIIEGINDANLKIKNEEIKQQPAEKTISKNIDLTQ